MKLKTHTYVTPRNNEKVRVWKEASRNRTLRLKSRTSPNIIIQIRSIKGYRPEGRFSSTPEGVQKIKSSKEIHTLIGRSI